MTTPTPQATDDGTLRCSEAETIPIDHLIARWRELSHMEIRGPYPTDEDREYRHLCCRLTPRLIAERDALAAARTERDALAVALVEITERGSSLWSRVLLSSFASRQLGNERTAAANKKTYTDPWEVMLAKWKADAVVGAILEAAHTTGADDE